MKRDLDYSWYENEDTYVNKGVKGNLLFPDHGENEVGEITTYKLINGELVKQ